MKFALANVPFTAEHIDALTRLAARYGSELTYFPPGSALTPSTLADCDALLGSFPPKTVKALPRLRWVQTPSAGVDHLRGAIDAGRTTLTNASGAFGVPIAEYMTAGLLMLYRRMPAYLKNQWAHIWRAEGSTRAIFGSVVTVVGMGDIGENFARRMRAMGARVRGVKRRPGEKPEYLEALYTTEALAEAVDGADTVALCLPATDETRGLIDEAILRRMKQGAVLINAGRGVTVDEDALIRALQDGHLGGAVLDVTRVEPLPTDSPLWEMENVILTPHISGSNGDPFCYNIIFEIFRGNLERFLTGAPLKNVVDASAGY